MDVASGVKSRSSHSKIIRLVLTDLPRNPIKQTKNNLSLTSSNIVKSNLPDLFGLNLGFKPSVLPGSYLEY